ncbi:MAG: FtsB family cell division protein [Cytophagaceae bacterium]
MLNRLPSFTKNFYFIFALIVFIWMLFFDSNDFINQYRMRQKLKELENQKAFYQEKIEQVKKDRQAFLNNHAELERFARENYLMKKKEEEVFVVIEE